MKAITGPSVRLAEIVMSTWGNLRVYDRVVEVGATHVVSQAYAHDLETNVAQHSEVRRRITTKAGKRFSDDMIAVTANAASAIARRNVIFGVVPRAVAEEVMDRALEYAMGGAKGIAERREAAMKYFTEQNVSDAEILTYLGREAVEDIDLNDIRDLVGVYQSIKDGSCTINSVFRPPRESTASDSKDPAQDLADRIHASIGPPIAPRHGGGFVTTIPGAAPPSVSSDPDDEPPAGWVTPESPADIQAEIKLAQESGFTGAVPDPPARRRKGAINL